MSEITETLRVLQVHNRYSPGWGGEDAVVDLEARLLKKRGHTVEQFQVSNASLAHASTLRQMLAVPTFLWSRSNYTRLKKAISRFGPDVVHVHNTFPLLSPSVFWAAHREGIPTVQTLHNFRHTCANAVVLRGDKPCEDCVGNFPWPALRHRCYANSFARTAAVVAMNVLHWTFGTYTRQIDGFIALNDFSRTIFVRAGLPSEKLFVKPNFVPAYTLGGRQRAAQVVFVGSPSRHKGAHLLLEGWRQSRLGNYQLLIIGDGPERGPLQKRFSGIPGITWCGSLDHSEVIRRIAESRALVLPSLTYENCPMVILEAFSVGTPVIVPDHSSFETIVAHQREGLIFHSGDAISLVHALAEALCAPQETWTNWSEAAKRAHVQRYSEAHNYERLLGIYRDAIQKRASYRSAKDHPRKEQNAAAFPKSAASDS
jgi:glycosyltransferase involved in cell wall biosynthesis